MTDQTKVSDVLQRMAKRTERAAAQSVPTVDLETSIETALTVAKEASAPRVRYAMVATEGHSLLVAFLDLSEPDYQTAIGSYVKDGKTIPTGGTLMYLSTALTVKDAEGKTVVLALQAREPAKNRRARNGKPVEGVPVKAAPSIASDAEAALFPEDDSGA